MSCEAKTDMALRAGGGRLTAQRRVIASALRHAGDHRSASELHHAVVQTEAGAGVSLSTVYRGLEALRASGLVAAVEGADGKTRYAWVDEARPHLHLRCSACRATVEVEGELLRGVAGAIRDRTGFDPFLEHLSVLGRCERCSGQRTKVGTTPDEQDVRADG